MKYCRNCGKEVKFRCSILSELRASVSEEQYREKMRIHIRKVTRMDRFGNLLSKFF